MTLLEWAKKYRKPRLPKEPPKKLIAKRGVEGSRWYKNIQKRIKQMS